MNKIFEKIILKNNFENNFETFSTANQCFALDGFGSVTEKMAMSSSGTALLSGASKGQKEAWCP